MDIFKSKLRKKLFAFYFTNIDKKLYLRELARLLKEDPSNLSKELNKLVDEKIFLAEEKGKEKYYFLNKGHLFFKELKIIIDKTIGVRSNLTERLSSIKGIKQAFIFGSFARNMEDANRDIDLIIIGQPNYSLLSREINFLECALVREINFHVYSEKEFKQRQKKDFFIKSILKEPIINLIKNEN